jgi:hypothetical protein
LSVTQKLEKEVIGIKMGSKAFEESKVVVASKDKISQAEQYPFFWVSTLCLPMLGSWAYVDRLCHFDQQQVGEGKQVWICSCAISSSFDGNIPYLVSR